MWPPFLLDFSTVSGGVGGGTKPAPAGRRIAAFFMLLMLNLQSALGKHSILIYAADWGLVRMVCYC